MYFKLSLKNIRKSFRDYTIYFLTLTFGVCIFYIFNAIEAQKAMMSISESTAQMMRVLTQLMGIISVFISATLGFLVVYSNGFLIRRRKREIGIYLTLGMRKGRVAKILVTELLLIGVLSLGVGLLVGVFLSQGLSVVTAKLFQADMTGYRFIFSVAAFTKTIIYFGVIFIVAMVLSAFSISRYKLIDLINAEKRKEEQKLKRPIFIIILFTLSVICLGNAYRIVLKNGLLILDKKLVFAIILGIVGTFFFFASLSGFFLKLLQTDQKRYFKDLNMFILRQIYFRINTTHLSMSLICLMLFCTIGILSTGLGINTALNRSFQYNAPYDVSFRTNGEESIVKKLKQYGFDLNEYTDQPIEFSLYTKDNLTRETILDNADGLQAGLIKRFNPSSPIYLLKLTDYNKLMDLQGKETIVLAKNQVAIYSDLIEMTPKSKKAFIDLAERRQKIQISGRTYGVYPRLLTESVETKLVGDTIIGLVVSDKMVEESKVYQTLVSFNCKGDSKQMQRKLESDLLAFAEKNISRSEEIKISASTKDSIMSISAGSKAIVSFICIYVGIIFLITSAVILALQQLSEAADNTERYGLLQKIGADEKMISSALFKQIAIYFLLPLTLAGIHSIVGIKVANDVIRDAGKVDATFNIIMTAILITFIYGSYFLATYFSSKRMILRNRG